MVLSRQEMDEIRVLATREVDAINTTEEARGYRIWQLMNVMIQQKIKEKGLLA